MSRRVVMIGRGAVYACPYCALPSDTVTGMAAHLAIAHPEYLGPTPEPDWRSLCARMAEALRMQTPPPRRPGCWCHQGRDVGREGHAENCDRARDALADYAAATKTGQSAGGGGR